MQPRRPDWLQLWRDVTEETLAVGGAAAPRIPQDGESAGAARSSGKVRGAMSAQCHSVLAHATQIQRWVCVCVRFACVRVQNGYKALR